MIFNKMFNLKVLNKASNFGPLLMFSTALILLLSSFLIKDVYWVCSREDGPIKFL